MTFVLDSSTTIAWFVADEHSVHTQALLDRVAEDGAIVPDLWRLEVGNALVMAVRRRRVTLEQRAVALEQLSALPIVIDPHTDLKAWGETLALADRFTLTLYDACYLELAHRRRLPLASLDHQLQSAGRTLGIELLAA